MSAFGGLLRDFGKPRRLAAWHLELLMGYNPFGTVGSYKEMLAKISEIWANFRGQDTYFVCPFFDGRPGGRG